jgi:hypothetical protein
MFDHMFDQLVNMHLIAGGAAVPLRCGAVAKALGVCSPGERLTNFDHVWPHV